MRGAAIAAFALRSWSAPGVINLRQRVLPYLGKAMVLLAMVMPTPPSRLLSAGSSAQSAESAALRPSWFNALNLYQSVALSCERRGVGSSPASSSQ